MVKHENQVTADISNWMRELEDGSKEQKEAARSKLAQNYFEKLVRQAKNALAVLRPGARDPEMAVVSALSSALSSVAAGRVPGIVNRDSLWQFLLFKLHQKAINQIRKEQAAKRGGGQVIGATDLRQVSEDDTDADAFAMALASDPTPEDYARLEEIYRHAMEALPNDELRQIATLHLQEHTNPEISRQVGRALRTVEYKLQLIRENWKARLSEEAYGG